MSGTARPSSDSRTRPDPEPGADRVADPLRHHGDVEAREGLLDFAVNAHRSAQPGCELPDNLTRNLHLACQTHPAGHLAHLTANIIAVCT